LAGDDFFVAAQFRHSTVSSQHSFVAAQFRRSAARALCEVFRGEWRPEAPALLVGPHRIGLDLIGHRRSLILASAAFQTADQPDGHVVIASDLAAKSHTGIVDLADAERFLFGFGDFFRLTVDEFDAASRAFGESAAGVKLVGARVLDECFDKSFSRGDIKRSDAFDSQFGHCVSHSSGVYVKNLLSDRD
jgi:hypothetical protein